MTSPTPIPALPYGPNTRAVRRFLQRFAALGDVQWHDAAQSLDAVEATPRYRAADRALGMSVERTGRGAERDAVVGPLLQLVRDPAHAVAPAALGAVLALMMRDVLSDADFETLYRPFAELIPAREL